MRVVQSKGTRGSLKWIQIAVEKSPNVLKPEGLPAIEWVSPLVGDGYAEYRDTAFLDILGLGHLSEALKAFWPSRGPQWDALGRTSNGPVLVEAKAHLREFFTSPSQAGPASRKKIEDAFATVRADLEIRPRADWVELYYQYANRLSFLWWLREQGVDAKLVFVSFLSDAEMGGPDHAETWEAAFAAADYALGLPERNKLRPHIYHVMPDVRELQLIDDGDAADMLNT